MQLPGCTPGGWNFPRDLMLAQEKHYAQQVRTIYLCKGVSCDHRRVHH